MSRVGANGELGACAHDWGDILATGSKAGATVGWPWLELSSGILALGPDSC